MNWQVKYALANFAKKGSSVAEHLGGDVIRIVTEDRPDVVAAISPVTTVDQATAAGYRDRVEGLDFLCGYRAECVWEGEAIRYLEDNHVGWGSFGTLQSAVLDGNANTAQHKVYKFSDRLLRQYGPVAAVDREFDRIYRVTLRSGEVLRIGMIADYEPTADAVRSLWDRFGPVDIIWNTNPNGTPQPEANDAGKELGCEVLLWDALRQRLG